MNYKLIFVFALVGVFLAIGIYYIMGDVDEEIIVPIVEVVEEVEVDEIQYTEDEIPKRIIKVDVSKKDIRGCDSGITKCDVRTGCQKQC